MIVKDFIDILVAGKRYMILPAVFGLFLSQRGLDHLNMIPKYPINILVVMIL